MRRAQLSFGDGLIAAEVDDLCEDWMKHADQVLADEQLVAAVYEAFNGSPCLYVDAPWRHRNAALGCARSAPASASN
jgi:hypothetical protein